MTWTKLGDEFADECWTLSDAAFRLHTEGLLWNNRMTTDGQLAKEDMRRWARHPEAAEELVSIGWWEDRGTYYQIIHHIGYQRTKEQIAKQSIANKANADKRWGNNLPKPAEESSCDSQSDSQCEMARTGQAWIQESGKALSGDGKTDDTDADYAEDVRDWYAEDEREHLEELADHIVRGGYDR
jgi:hypothetical protein